MLKPEAEVDVGNTDYRLIYKKNGNVVCRCCGLNVKGKRMFNKSNVEHIARDCLGKDFSEDNDFSNPDKICSPCFLKFSRLKTSKTKFDKLRQKNPNYYKDIQFTADTTIDLNAGNLPCKNYGTCK